MIPVLSGGLSIVMNLVILPSQLSQSPQVEGELSLTYICLTDHYLYAGHIWLATVWGSWQDLMPALVCIHSCG